MGNKQLVKLNKSWTLFLDRDGVINHRLKDDYVKNWSEFQFEPGVLEAIASFSKVFGRIFVVTNQQGIGKNIMSEDDLLNIHHKMLAKIEAADGKIDRVYCCPHLRTDDCNCRKPRIGMALQAKEDFPEIDFSRSVMVGDTPSDIEFGKRAGMHTVFISKEENPPPHTEFHFPSLHAFAKYLAEILHQD